MSQKCETPSEERGGAGPMQQTPATATTTMVSADSMRTSSRDLENRIVQPQLTGSHFSSL